MPCSLRDTKALGYSFFLRRQQMSTKIYVGNLSFNATEDEIRELFAPFGEIESVKIITDKQTGRPRGFGFVEMPSSENALKAIEALNGKAVMDRNLSVSEARPQEPRDRGAGNRGGGFGQNKGPGFGAGRRPERGRR
jgi:cold-inducible RNA-binding protein